MDVPQRCREYLLTQLILVQKSFRQSYSSINLSNQVLSERIKEAPIYFLKMHISKSVIPSLSFVSSILLLKPFFFLAFVLDEFHQGRAFEVF